jgi:predicted RNA methylase
VVYDLGCGNGRIVIAAANIYGARGVGIDIDPRRILESKTMLRRQVSRVWFGSKRTTCSRRRTVKLLERFKPSRPMTVFYAGCRVNNDH